jgi:hypothetical protein
METKTKNAKGVQGTTAQAKQTTDVKTENRPSIPGKEKNDEPVKDQKPAEGAQGEANQVAEVEAGHALTVDNKPANPAGQPEKQELKLEDKLKTVNDLHRITVQRVNLLSRMADLEKFEVAQVADADELDNNPYNRCTLSIKDDKGREFKTNTPNLIRLVTQFIYDACEAKKQELESKIVFPN